MLANSLTLNEKAMHNKNSVEKLKRLLFQKAEIKNVDYKLTFNWNEASKEDKGKINNGYC